MNQVVFAGSIDGRTNRAGEVAVSTNYDALNWVFDSDDTPGGVHGESGAALG